MKKLVPDDAILIPDTAQRVFEGKIFDVYHWPQAMFNGTTATFEMLKRPDTVIVIALVDDAILLIDEAQPNYDSRLGYPSGRVDPKDASTLVAAQRECLEETGYSFTNWKLVAVHQPEIKLDWFVYVYVAHGVTSLAEKSLDSGERITLKPMPFDQARDWTIDRDRSWGVTRTIFEQATTAADLLALPEFQGREIDR